MSAIVHERLVPLERGFNLRDFGGYATTDGRRVKRGMLFRSGTMALLTPDDEAHLRTLGVRAIFDFRRGDERAAEPTRWHESTGAHYWSRDYVETSGILTELLRDPDTTPEQMGDTMMTLYRDMVTDHAPSYGAMLARLADGGAPLLINCAAGKDRTGVGAALILSALGVAREDIEQDYLLTNSLANWKMMLDHHDGGPNPPRRQSPELMNKMMTADVSYLAAAFAEMDEAHGGIEGYISGPLGVDAAALERMRAHLLEE